MNLVVKIRHERRFYDFFTTFDDGKPLDWMGWKQKCRLPCRTNSYGQVIKYLMKH